MIDYHGGPGHNLIIPGMAPTTIRFGDIEITDADILVPWGNIDAFGWVMVRYLRSYDWTAVALAAAMKRRECAEFSFGAVCLSAHAAIVEFELRTDRRIPDDVMSVRWQVVTVIR